MKKTVLDYDDIVKMIPRLEGKRKLVNRVIRMLAIDQINRIHEHNFDAGSGPAFCRGLLTDLNIKLQIDGLEVLDNLPEGAFITVSNHPFGAIDGITLIDIVGSRRPEFKVMVNMILGYITALKPSFITVDALATDDPKKRAVSMQGIKDCIRQVRSGQPIGFFPAGAVSKLNRKLRLEDRKWQPTIIRLIQQLKVPVIPIFFHGSNSHWFNFLGMISWKLRTLRLPAEVFNKRNHTIHVSVGQPIGVDEIMAHSESLDELGSYLKGKTYALRGKK